ncbi:MBL fold metallo-hydrolase [Novosphingobium piscinae]|uniref:MBL fold metallo-hydrolase n=1 Tax=Novosphingobium piscinae TaxID=1507448 RepID=A0A7X1FVH5_9SPHN|nr:MBL fold metallo-hydrolase [Novosphingobium piscinae]MBC2667735.1 MBL fold metallo-hydrolase [Novosphingobium piscinae]
MPADTAGSAPAPALAGLVRSGDAQAAAIAVTDFVYQVNDISNLYLVTTDDGDVLVNTGFMDNAERNVALLAPHRTGPLRTIVLTQSHADHFGGLDAFRESGTEVIGGPGFDEAWADMKRLQPFFGPRSAKLWASTLRRGGTPKPPPEVKPDRLVDRVHAFTIGGRAFELIHAPEGETVDNLIVWLPHDRIAFTGNLVGPVWLSMPFFCTLRGDKPRAVWNTLKSLRKLRDLAPEIVITGHGEPIRGADRIAADIDRMIGAIEWVRDFTLDGMNAGKTVHQLMAEVALPAHLTIGEFHGKVSWAVKTIWDEYAGWFHYEDGTTALYHVPRSAVHGDLVALAGADALAARARDHLAAGRPLEGIHLSDIVLGVEPAHRGALEAKRDAHQALLAAATAGNLSETMWLRSEIADAERRLEALG